MSSRRQDDAIQRNGSPPGNHSVPRNDSWSDSQQRDDLVRRNDIREGGARSYRASAAPQRKRGFLAAPVCVAAALALALASGLASLSFASGQGPAEPDSGVSSTSAAKEAAAARGPVGNAPGKPVAAFTLDYTLEGQIHAAGVPLELRISLRPQSAIDNVAVQVSADTGLYIDPADSLLSAASVSRDAPAEWVVHVTPVDEGRFHVKLYAEGDIGGSRQGRSVMVPIQVGEAKDAADATQKVGDDDGGVERDSRTESLIRLPADAR